MDNVKTTTGRDVWLNVRINPQVREEFKIAADLRGASMSSLIHQFIVKTIREEKDKSPIAFKGKAGPKLRGEVESIYSHQNEDTPVGARPSSKAVAGTTKSIRGGRKKKPGKPSDKK